MKGNTSMTYIVLIKDLETETIKEGPSFADREVAEAWVDIEMVMWEEVRAYKIVEVAN